MTNQVGARTIRLATYRTNALLILMDVSHMVVEVSRTEPFGAQVAQYLIVAWPMGIQLVNVKRLGFIEGLRTEVAVVDGRRILGKEGMLC